MPALVSLVHPVLRASQVLQEPVAGWPLAKPMRLGSRVEMVNLIGQEISETARWMTVPGASVHVYGKGEARAGRKMGHVTRVWPAK